MQQMQYILSRQAFSIGLVTPAKAGGHLHLFLVMHNSWPSREIKFRSRSIVDVMSDFVTGIMSPYWLLKSPTTCLDSL